MNNPLMIFYNIPIILYIAFVLLIVTWSFYLLYRKRKRNYSTDYYVGSSYGYKDILEIIYDNAFWKIQIPIEDGFIDKYLFGLPKDRYNYLIVHLPPLCMNCKCELEEKRSLIRGYNWSCPFCGKKIKSRYNYKVISSKVLKIAKQNFNK